MDLKQTIMLLDPVSWELGSELPGADHGVEIGSLPFSHDGRSHIPFRKQESKASVDLHHQKQKAESNARGKQNDVGMERCVLLSS